MRRREFITLLGGAAAAWPLAARAQQPERMRRVGVLMNLAVGDPEGEARVAAFLQALQQLGWSDGRNVRIDTAVLCVRANVCSWGKSGRAADITAMTDLNPKRSSGAFIGPAYRP